MSQNESRIRKHCPLDMWTVREKLSLGCSVLRSGDQNWASAARAIRPFMEPNRPPEWFAQKNCALQYADMLEKIETPRRKRGDKQEQPLTVGTPVEQIVRKFTIERVEELRKLIIEEQQNYKKIKKEVDLIKTGQMDDKVKEMWEEIQKEKKVTEEETQAPPAAINPADNLMPLEIKSEPEAIADISFTELASDVLNIPLLDDKTTGPGGLTVKIDSSTSSSLSSSSSSQQVKPTPPPSPLLTTLLQSHQKSFLGLQQVKTEAEHEALMTKLVPCLPDINTEAASSVAHSSPATTMIKLIPTNTPPVTPSVPATAAARTPASTSHTVMSSSTPNLIIPDKTGTSKGDRESPIDPILISASPIKEESEKGPMSVSNEEDKESLADDNAGFISIDEEISIKEEPSSPASSVSSKFSEPDSKSKSRRRHKGRGSKSSRKHSRGFARKTQSEDDKRDDTSSRHSDAETSDIDTESLKNDDTASQPEIHPIIAFTDSLPSSPASLSVCSDTEDEKAFKTWKKSIMLVWRAAATHKYANVFLHPVTNDIAPGYLDIVHRPINLTQIKKNVESGAIRTTAEFQRDMMLMFTNAIMYNSSSHNVYKMATEMYDDVLQQIEQYNSTQLMVQQNESKLLRASRRSETTTDKVVEDETKKRRQSTDIPPDGGKSKKRRA